MKKERIFITVKTYPAISNSYGELVCTAGIREDGSWIRIYPVPFRTLESWRQYTKYQWIEALIKRNESDSRPESFKVVDIDGINLLDKVSDWKERKNIILAKNKVYEDLEELIDLAKNKNALSLAVFKPKIIKCLKVEKDTNYKKHLEKKTLLKKRSKQTNLFGSSFDDFEPVDRLPFKFSYVFEDVKGKESSLMIEDWEIGVLYWKCFRYAQKKNRNLSEDELMETAVKKVRSKYEDFFLKERDILLFLGTTKRYHSIAPNPFVIIGVFYPPIEKQLSFSF